MKVQGERIAEQKHHDHRHEENDHERLPVAHDVPELFYRYCPDALS